MRKRYRHTFRIRLDFTDWVQDHLDDNVPETLESLIEGAVHTRYQASSVDDVSAHVVWEKAEGA